jgi:hypothetical protein
MKVTNVKINKEVGGRSGLPSRQTAQLPCRQPNQWEHFNVDGRLSSGLA